MEIGWLNYVDAKRRRNFLRILQELSKMQKKDTPNFIIIGAIPLLMTDYLTYVVQWDIDLLFRDSSALREFVGQAKPANLRVVNYDDDFMAGENITSFHTAWSFDRSWFNVDYILRSELYVFYAREVSELRAYNHLLKLAGDNYQLELLLAHPWDVFLEKTISPRAEEELALKIDMSVDLRHVFIIYEKEKNNSEFWRRILGKARRIGVEQRFKENLLKIFAVREELGYGDVEISGLSLEQLK